MTELDGQGHLAAMLSATRGPAMITMSGSGVLTVGGAVRAVTDAIDTPGITMADLHTLATTLTDAIRTGTAADQVADQVEKRTPLLGGFGKLLRDNEGLLVLIGIIVAVIIARIQAPETNAPPAAPPTVTVQVNQLDPAEVERIVDERLNERLRELEQQEKPDAERQPGRGHAG